jgi:transposase InsO family protein
MAAGANRRELCRRYGVSPTTAYKWLRRYAAGGEACLQVQSRRPQRQPRRSSEEIEAAVLALRAEHQAWGGRKIARRLWLDRRLAVAPSTVTAILRRHGVELGQFGGGAQPYIRFEHAQPNDLWQMDYKGHVALRQGRLHPLTVLDDHSRFAMVLAACADERTQTVRGHLTRAFEHYGLPWRMAMDNGSPWGDGPETPYTPLGVWLLERDIRITHSRPYHPQTLGKDERFHRTLKAEVLSGPPFDSLAEAQSAFDRWREIYNLKRPHQAIGMDTPVDRYKFSMRTYRPEPEPFDYAPGDSLRRVQQHGRLDFKGRTWRVPRAFRGKTVALRSTDNDGCYDVLFRTTKIATIDLRAQSSSEATGPGA